MSYCIECGNPIDDYSLMCENCTISNSPWLLALKNETAELSKQIMRLEAENAELHERLEKAVGLPVMVGDRVFCTIGTPPIVEEFEVEKIVIRKEFTVLDFRGINIDLGIASHLSEYKKVWFIEREAAEARLKELKENDNG